MRRTPLILVSLSFLASACGGDIVSPDAGTSHASRRANPAQVPFRLTVIEGSSVGAPGGRCGPFPMITVDIAGTAVGTHLGRSSVQQSHCQNAFDPSGAFTDGEFTNTGADGSTIFGTYHGVLVPTSDPTQLEIRGSFIIAGGTGRFDGATGSGAATGLLDTTTGEPSLELVGTISSVGSGLGASHRMDSGNDTANMYLESSK